MRSQAKGEEVARASFVREKGHLRIYDSCCLNSLPDPRIRNGPRDSYRFEVTEQK